MKIFCTTKETFEKMIRQRMVWEEKIASHISDKELISKIYRTLIQFRSVQSLSHVHLFAALWTAALQASLSITNSRSLLKLGFTELAMPSNRFILCHSLLLWPSIFPSIRGFSSEAVLHIIWPKYWSFSFSISPSNECSGLISFRIDWSDLLAVQGTPKSLLHPEPPSHLPPHPIRLGHPRMGNTCKSMADSYQYMAKTTTIL